MFLRSGPRAMMDDGDRSPFGSFWFGPVPSRGGIVSTDDAMRLTAVYRAVRLLSGSIGTLPFILWKRAADGSRTRVTDHWLYRLFALRPNDFQDPVTFRKMMQAHIELRGNAYAEIVSTRSGQITDLLPMHPDRVRIETLDGGNWRYRYRMPDGSNRILSRTQVFHRRDLTLDGVIGINPIQAARGALDAGIAAQDYGRRFFENNAQPGGWIEYPGTFKTEEDRKTFREQLQALWGGRNQGKTGVLDRGMKYHEVGVKNTDAQWLETRKYTVTEIARLFGVPPHKLGDLDRSTNNNIEQQSMDFVNDALLERIVNWESAIRFELLGDAEPDLEVELDLKALLRGDSTARANYLSKAVGGPWMTRNEARNSENMNELDGLDEVLRPVNMAEENEVDPDDPGAGGKPGDADEPPPAAPAPPAPAPAQPKQDARLAAMTAAAIDRIARKESALRAKAGQDLYALMDAYAKHGDFVAAALAIDRASAGAYYLAQVARFAGAPVDPASRDQWEADADRITRAELARLVE